MINAITQKTGLIFIQSSLSFCAGPSNPAIPYIKSNIDVIIKEKLIKNNIVYLPL